MMAYALFHDGTAKDVRIILNRNDRNLLEVGQIGVISDSVFVSARNAIQQSWPLLLKKQLLEENKRHLLVTPLGFGREVDGKSAGLAFALAFVFKLSEEGFINHPLKISGNVAATGIIDDAGDVQPITHIEEKAIAAMEHGCVCLFLPGSNEAQLREVPEMIERIQSSGMKLVSVDSVQDFINKLVGLFSADEVSDRQSAIHQTGTIEIHSSKERRKSKLWHVLLPVLVAIMSIGIFLARPLILGVQKNSEAGRKAVVENMPEVSAVPTNKTNTAYTTSDKNTVATLEAFPSEQITPLPTEKSLPTFVPTEILMMKSTQGPTPVKFTLPRNTKAPDSFSLAALCNPTRWTIDPASSSAQLSNVIDPKVGEALQISYSLEKGESFKISVKADDNFKSLAPYRNLKFKYFFAPQNSESSTNNTQISCFVALRNGSERNVEIGETKSITANQWNIITVKGISVNEITTIRVFIGDISFVHQDLNKGKLLIREFVAY